ncbi:MAG: hypothetical protein HY866_17055 [Chloroflexi bacterium]|nr:hypothetical protein [Chloroflexota bacterium]
MKTKQLAWLRVTLFILMAAAAVFGAAQSPTHVTEAQGGTPISYGTSVFNVISENASSITYTFNGTLGDLVQIEVQSVSGTLNPSADLIGPDQLSLANGQYNRLTMREQAAHIAAFLPQSGIYTVVVRGLSSSVGDFALSLHGRGAIPATTLQYGVAIDVSIVENTPPQYFVFDTADCPTTLIITNLFGGDPFTFRFVARVRDERGREVALLRGGDVQEDRITVPANSGRYEVEIFADDPALMGLISLMITCAADAPGCGGTASTTGLNCPCPTCPGSPFPGGSNTQTCPDTRPLATVVDPENRGTALTWYPVPGADHYLIYLYGLREDDEIYLGLVVVPGDATEFVFGHLYPDFYGFRFEIEAIQGEVPICAAETTVTFTDTQFVCPDLNLRGEITSEAERSVHWTWNTFPDADAYSALVSALMPDGTGWLVQTATLESESTSFDTWHPVGEPPTDTFVMALRVIMGDTTVCPASARVTFQPQGPGEECANFQVYVAVSPEEFVEIQWPTYPSAAGYVLNVTNEAGVVVPGFPIAIPPEQNWYSFGGLAPGNYIVTIGVQTPDGRSICERQQTFQVGGGSDDTPCQVIAETANVQVHVGPGRHRGIFAYMESGIPYTVTGQALDPDGNVWWQLDKTQFAGHEGVISLWVAASDVVEEGNCTNIPEAEIPPIVPDEPEQPGGWGACGSCDTCGHPGECVTSPEGQCLWDPATCAGQPPPGDDDPPPGDDDPPPPDPQCVLVTASVNPGGTGSAGPVTAGNCVSEIAGIYLPGTTVTVQAWPNSGCWVDHWSGCTSGGATNSVTFTVNATCHATAHIQCMQ